MIEHVIHSHAAISPPAAVPRFGALPVLLRRHFSPFKTYVRRDLGLAVFLNPKVGSTSFRKILVEGLQSSGIPPMLGSYWPINLQRRYLTAPPTDYLDALLHPDRYQFYAFVRNPYARLLSAWKDKIAGHDRQDAFPRGVRRLGRDLRRFAASHDLPGGRAGTTIPFATFVAFVASQREGARNHHLDTQRSVLFTDVIRYQRIFRMESEFAAGMTEILTRIGLPRSWVAEKLQHPQNASQKIRTAQYDAAIADQVHRVFAADFEDFGYDRDSWQGL